MRVRVDVCVGVPVLVPDLEGVLVPVDVWVGVCVGVPVRVPVVVGVRVRVDV